nr:mannose-1-phosphate guanylyltransferase [Saprospiraceae bacterium]
MRQSIYVAIMAGGAGTRFWPASVKEKPKQFLDVLGTGSSLLEETFKRFRTFVPAEQIRVVSGEKYSGLIKEQLKVDQQSIIPEPMMRNTAAAVALTAFEISHEDPDAIIVMTPADHLIQNRRAFEEVILKCTDFAAHKDSLITLGIQPHSPHTGYGYIKKGSPENGLFQVERFTEKPNEALAAEFVESGDYFWNAGIFVWSAKSILRAFFEHAIEIYNPLAGLFRKGKPNLRDLREVYQTLPSISVDYAIMEKAESVYLCPADFGWSDLGSWNTIYELSEKDKTQNSAGQSPIVALESRGNLIRGQKDKLYTLIGMEGMGIVDTGEVLIIFPLSKDQDVKKMVEEVRKQFGDKYD